MPLPNGEDVATRILPVAMPSPLKSEEDAFFPAEKLLKILLMCFSMMRAIMFAIAFLCS